jgi:hypothetical protein
MPRFNMPMELGLHLGARLLEPEKRFLQRRIQELKNNFYRLSIWARLKRL